MEQIDNIRKYLDIAHRRQWWIIIPLLLSLLAGLTYAMKAPNIFEAETLILIVAQKVPQNYVRAIVSLSMEERLRTIKQQVCSRTNLERTIEEHHLFRESNEVSMLIEDKVKDFRKRIRIDVTQGTAFKISFRDKNPQKAMDVTNDLASRFISENLKIREGQAIGTSHFLDEELNSVKKKLEEKESLLKEYQRKYMGAMPEQLQTNLSMLGRFQSRLEQLAINLSATESRKLTIQQQMANMEMMQQQMGEIGIEDSLMDTDPSMIIQESANLMALKEELSSLKSRYTDKHPDVVRLQKMIDKIEAEETSDSEVSETESGLESETDFTELEPTFDSQGYFLKPQLEQIQIEISNIKEEINKVKDKIESYQKRVEETPKREQELLVLKRDYQNLVGLHDSLLARKLEADIAVSMEKKQKGEQFKILDLAKLPERPVEPNINIIIIISLVVGLGLGGGLAFLVENLHPGYYAPEEVENELHLPVLVTVPIRHTEKEQKDIRTRTVLLYASTGLVFILSAIGIVIAAKGMDKTMEFFQNLFVGT